jgi:hypothetical protein
MKRKQYFLNFLRSEHPQNFHFCHKKEEINGNTFLVVAPSKTLNSVKRSEI